MDPPTQTVLRELALLGCIEGIGRRTLRKIQQLQESRIPDWASFWVPTPAVIEFLSLSNKQVESIKTAKKEHFVKLFADSETRCQFRLIGTESAEYPPLLKEVDGAPPFLYVLGPTMEWQAPAIPVALVGTRKVTAYGSMVTERLTLELVDLEAVIVSGLMYGVDSIAHLTASRAGGKTIAVLGYGFEHCYPPEHQPVFDELLKHGATFISEYPPWKTARKGNFPARNSIVAGMSAAVVVTEAAIKSGSMITAQYAVDEGRTVCAVPGPITNPYCEGTKWLINEGAVLVSSGTDVLDQLYQPATSRHQKTAAKALGSTLARTRPVIPLSSSGACILELLERQPLTIDDLLRQLPIAPQEIASEISLLEMSGLVLSEAGLITKNLRSA